MKRSNIEWCDYTWNPITGCQNRCAGCNARKVSARFCGDIRRNRYSQSCCREAGNFILAEPFNTPESGYIPYPFGYEPTLHEYRLSGAGSPGQYRMGVAIHVGSMGECFGPWIPDLWLQRIFEVCNTYAQHKYLFLTKHPGRYTEALEKAILPSTGNCWYGTTVTQGVIRTSELYTRVPVFINFEPLTGEISFEHPNERSADWFIIGGWRGSRNQHKGIKREWIETILTHADRHDIPVFMNRSLQGLMGREELRRDYPEALISTNKQAKYIAACVKCGTMKPKKEMVALLARSASGESPRQFACICRDCMPALCQEWNIERPEQEMIR